MLLAEVPDIRITIDDRISRGDWVAVRATGTGTHNRTATPIRFHGGGFGRFVDGRLVEAWNAWDFLGCLEQLGALPPQSLPRGLTGELKID